jgi:hypothetical protein
MAGAGAKAGTLDRLQPDPFRYLSEIERRLPFPPGPSELVESASRYGHLHDLRPGANFDVEALAATPSSADGVT